MAQESNPAVAQHYARPRLLESILDLLRAAGKNIERLRPADLAGVDQFHTGGRDATLDLLCLANLTPTAVVLDAGGGLGGPARTLAESCGCSVTVLDASDDYCAAGTELTRRCGLSDRVTFRRGNMLRTPFDDGSFDCVWTQHATMNVVDRPTLYREFRRILRRGGTLAFDEVETGPGGPLHYPVPWAATPEQNYLLPADRTQFMLRQAGFEQVSWEDVSEASANWIRERLTAATDPDRKPGLSLALLLGESFPAAFRNHLRNLVESRTRIVRAVFRAIAPQPR